MSKNGYLRIIIKKDPYTDTRNYVPLLFEVSATTTLTYSDEEVTTILKQGHLYQSEILGINVASHILEKAGGQVAVQMYPVTAYDNKHASEMKVLMALPGFSSQHQFRKFH